MRALVLAAALTAASIRATGAAAAPHAGLHDRHPCPGVAGFTCATVDVPLDHARPSRGTLHLRVAAGDNRNAPRGVLLVLAGGPGESGLPILGRFVAAALARERSRYRIVVFDQRGTGAGALDCPALQAEMGSSDLTPPSAGAVRACARQLGTRRAFFGTDDVVADMEDLRRGLGVDTWSLDGISYGTYVGERYALAHPSRVKKLVLDSVVPQIGETDLGVDEFAAVRRVLGSVCGSRCVADLAAVVRRYHLGPQLLDALTFDSIADPTYRTSWDVPGALHAARAGDRTSSTGSSPPRPPTRRARPRRRSTRACTRARSAPTGGIRGATRGRRSPAAGRRCVPPWPGSPHRASTRSTPRPRRETASSVSACPGPRPPRPRSPTAGWSSRLCS